ncbi:MAG: ATP-binding protein, partial [Ktedonobacterales bacterium]
MPKAEKTLNPNRNTLWLRRYGAALAAGLLVILFTASGIISYLSIRTVADQEAQVYGVRTVVVVIANIYSDLRGVEADAYRFVIRGDSDDLQDFLASRQDLNGQLTELHVLVISSGAQQQQATELQRQVSGAVLSLQTAVVLREAGKTRAATQLIGASVTVQTLDSSSSTIGHMERTWDSKLTRTNTAAAAVSQATKMVIVLVFLSDLILLTIIAMLVRQSMRFREEMAEELAQARNRTQVEVLEETNRRMDEFISIASHEFRTPLTTLKANLQLAARRLLRPRVSSGNTAEGCAVPAPDLVPLIERASQAANRLERLASDLLDLSRITAGELVMRPVPLELGSLVDDCVAEQRLSFPGRVITQDSPLKPTPVVADPDRIRQAIANYLTNALKFSSSDKPVRVILSQDGHQARVSVQDSGPGLCEGEQKRIWERFQRASGVTPKSGSNVGLGLGLYISKTIIERHGGQVGVDSQVGEGATFWFTLPL